MKHIMVHNLPKNNGDACFKDSAAQYFGTKGSLEGLDFQNAKSYVSTLLGYVRGIMWKYSKTTFNADSVIRVKMNTNIYFSNAQH